MLTVETLSKYFGGVGANLEVDLALEAGGIHALIGPNGAGKSTLIAQIAGELKPDGGHIFFRGRDISHAPPEQRNRLGIGLVSRSWTAREVFIRRAAGRHQNAPALARGVALTELLREPA